MRKQTQSLVQTLKILVVRGEIFALTIRNVAGGTRYPYLFDSKGTATGDLLIPRFAITAGQTLPLVFWPTRLLPFFGAYLASSDNGTTFNASGGNDFEVSVDLDPKAWATSQARGGELP